MSKLIINIGKSVTQPAATALTMVNTNLLAASGVVAGMELSGFASTSTFSTGADAASEHQQKVDSLIQLSLLTNQGSEVVLQNHALPNNEDALSNASLIIANEKSNYLSLLSEFNISNVKSEILEDSVWQNDQETTHGFEGPFADQTVSQNGSFQHGLDGGLIAVGDQENKSSLKDVGLISGASGMAAGSLNNQGVTYKSPGGGLQIFGTINDDTLIGSHGVDTLIGDAGDDVYVIYSDKTNVVENANEGYDVLYSAVNGYKTEASIERIQVLNTTEYLSYTKSPDHLLKSTDIGWHIYGNESNQTLIGGKQADFLDGLGGSDTLIGGLGDDVYMYTGAETILESASQGFDIVKTTSSVVLPSNIEAAIVDTSGKFVNLTGNSLGNILVGGSDANTLIGGGGDDTLVGAGGEDLYIGGQGSDTYLINGSESFAGEIQDYEFGVDKIVFSLSPQSQPAQLSFSNDVFHGVAGEILLFDGMIQADLNGDSVSDVLLLVNTLPDQNDISFMDPKDLPGF